MEGENHFHKGKSVAPFEIGEAIWMDEGEMPQPREKKNGDVQQGTGQVIKDGQGRQKEKKTSDKREGWDLPRERFHYFAIPTALVSRTTVTLMVPG